MRTLKKIKKTAVAIITLLLISNFSYSQKLEKLQPSSLFAVDKDHNPVNIKFGINTSNPQYSLEVKGQIFADSVRIKGSLYIGDSSLYIGSQLTPTGTSDLIQSNNPSINFGRKYTVPTIGGFSKINIGVGMQNPHHKVQLFDAGLVHTNPVHISFTNGIFLMPHPPLPPQGTGSLATDGFLVGIAANGNAQLIQQENLPMQFLVNGSTIPSTPFTSERMRITAGQQTISGELENNITRVGIWRNGTTGEPNPLSLLQIGYPATPSLAGHRDWMDVGTYSNVRALNMYVGMLFIDKDENRHEAIIDWGSSATTTAALPRSMRFIYTTEQTGNLLSADYEGLEASRWWSNGNQVRIGFGGNPGTNLYFMGSEDPTQTVEINSPGTYVADEPGFSGLRFTDLRENSSHVPLNPDQGVLSVNESGDVIYVDADGGVGGADNDWYDLNNLGIPPTSINDDIYTQNRVNINTTQQAPIPYLSYQLKTFNNNNHIAGLFHTDGGIPILTVNLTEGIGVYALAENATYKNTGVYGIAQNGQYNVGTYNIAQNGQYNIGTYSIAQNGQILNIGILGTIANGPGYAGYFNGKVYSTSYFYTPGWSSQSDRLLKKDTSSFDYGLNDIRKFKPMFFRYNGKANLDTSRKYIGLIAQNLAQFAPYAVDTFYSKLDSADTVLTPLLAVKNEAIIYTAINAIKQLDSSVTVLEQTTPPNKPVLISPADSATDVLLDITVIWHKSVRATSYALFGRKERIEDPTHAGSTVLDREKEWWDVTTIVTDTFITFTLLDYCETYSWYIVALNDAGASTMSDIWSFTTITPEIPEPPILSSPANASVDLPLANTFIWNKAERTSEYQLYISADTGSISLVNVIDSRDTFTMASVFDYNTTYYWWVVASNCGGESIKSEIWSFTTVYDSAAPPETSEPLASDIAFKNNVIPISDALSMTLDLNGIYFNWDLVNFPELQDTGRQTGLIAQDVEQVIPEVVSTDVNGYLNVDYSRLVPVLIEAVKELNNKVEALQLIVSACCDTMSLKMLTDEQGGQTIYEQGAINEELQKTIHNIELSSNIVVLEQNRPNPFKENTSIDYFVPEDVDFAQIIFYNSHGRIIKLVDIKEKGKGQLQVFAQNLTDGIYTYSIVFDGKIAETKKMLKAK